MIQVIVEKWTSDDSREEIHLFVKGEQNEYVMGFNPDRFTDDDINAILEPLGLILPPKGEGP